MALGWLWWRAWFPVDAAVAAAVCVAGVALRDICLHFAWQAWQLATSTYTLRGRCDNYGIWWGAWFPAVTAAVAWQAWHLATSTSTLRGRCGTYNTRLALVARLVPSGRRGRRGCLRGRPYTWRHRPSLCMAGVALDDLDLHFAWQVWHLWH